MSEQWPEKLPAIPNVGDYITSQWKQKNGFRLELQVCRITWEYDSLNDEYIPEIELHMTKFQKGLPSRKGAADGSITAFYEWYAPKVGKSVGNFI
jgi:hypothetical protein